VNELPRAPRMAGAGVRSVNLALQGGGAHGAFTWGVLERLLEDETVAIEAISGTSAGALNAAVAASGLVTGGRDGARKALRRFWQAMSEASHASPLQRSPFDRLAGFLSGDPWSFDRSPSYFFFDVLTRFASPYELNPLGYNPLRAIVAQAVDFEALRSPGAIRVLASATNVHTGRVRVFQGAELTLDALMASACLPQLFHAVEIDGEPYWDGGYMGNPPLFPLIEASEASDTVLVQINPVERRTTPRTAREILNRLNEITFNATLMRELHMLDLLTRSGVPHRDGPATPVFLHRIDAGPVVGDLSDSSKLNAEPEFVEHLRRSGRLATEDFLLHQGEDLGRRSSFDIADFLA